MVISYDIVIIYDTVIMYATYDHIIAMIYAAYDHIIAINIYNSKVMHHRTNDCLMAFDAIEVVGYRTVYLYIQYL